MLRQKKQDYAYCLTETVPDLYMVPHFPEPAKRGDTAAQLAAKKAETEIEAVIDPQH